MAKIKKKPWKGKLKEKSLKLQVFISSKQIFCHLKLYSLIVSIKKNLLAPKNGKTQKRQNFSEKIQKESKIDTTFCNFSFHYI